MVNIGTAWVMMLYAERTRYSRADTRPAPTPCGSVGDYFINGIEKLNTDPSPFLDVNHNSPPFFVAKS